MTTGLSSLHFVSEKLQNWGKATKSTINNCEVRKPSEKQKSHQNK